MSFLSKLSGIFSKANTENEVRIDIEMSMYPSAFIKEIYKSRNLTDKDYILFTLLFFTRVLRVLTNIHVEKQLCTMFIETNEEIGQGITTTIESLKTKPLKSIVDVPHVHIQMKSRTIYVDDMSGLNSIENLYNYAILAFRFGWRNIKEDNRAMLFLGLVELSKENLREKISSVNAVEIPNYLITQMDLA